MVSFYHVVYLFLNKAIILNNENHIIKSNLFLFLHLNIKKRLYFKKKSIYIISVIMSKAKRIHKTYKKSLFEIKRIKLVNLLLFFTVICFIFSLIYLT